MKPTSTKALLLALLLVLGMIVSPVCAVSPIFPNLGMDEQYFDNVGTLTYNTTPGLAVAGIEIRVPYGTDLDFTINPGEASETTGTIDYTGTTVSSTHNISIGGNSESFYFPGDVLHAAYLHRVGVASNGTGDRGYYVSTEIMTSYFGQTAYKTVSGAAPITKFSISSNLPVNVRVVTESIEKAFTDLEPGGLGDLIPADIPKVLNYWLQLASQFSGSAIGFIWGVFWIIKFFFIDNLLLIIALWISVSMAYAAISSANIFVFYKKFFGLQRALVDFIISLWRILWEIVNYGVQIFVKWL